MSDTSTMDDAAQHFPNDTKDHVMDVKLDQGVFRHIRFAKPDSSTYAFAITTWPGHLAVSGDMGCFVFSRLHDMFEFFRHDRINPGYWAEKVVAEDSNGPGVSQWSPDRFREAVLSDAQCLCEDIEDEDSRIDLMSAIANEVLNNAYSQEEAYAAVCNFEHTTADGRTLMLEDFFEHRLTEYTYHFLWCLHAIVHAIKAYDSGKDGGRCRD